jgi:hypothetical protein
MGVAVSTTGVSEHGVTTTTESSMTSTEAIVLPVSVSNVAQGTDGTDEGDEGTDAVDIGDTFAAVFFKLLSLSTRK